MGGGHLGQSTRVTESHEPDFDVGVDHQAGVVIVRPTGALQDGSTQVLAEILGELASQGASAVLDLSGLSRIDDAGIRVVLEAYALSRRDGFGLTLLPGPPVVMRMFELSGALPQLGFGGPPA
jgi:anti-anti-sigma factor